MKYIKMIIKTDFQALLKKAKERAEIMVENGLYSRFGLSNSKRIEKALLGCMGELAFEGYLKQEGVNYSLDQSDFAIKNSDEFDFLISGKKFDIKVAKKTTVRPPSDSWTYGYPQEQNPQSKDYIVVGWIDFEKEEVAFYGWITGKEVSQYKVVSQNSFAKYQYLTPNHEFRWGAMKKDFKLLFSSLK
jgi:hypothetical protein